MYCGGPGYEVKQHGKRGLKTLILWALLRILILQENNIFMKKTDFDTSSSVFSILY